MPLCLAVCVGVMIEAASVAGGLGKRWREQREGRLPTHQALRLPGYDHQPTSGVVAHTLSHTSTRAIRSLVAGS